MTDKNEVLKSVFGHTGFREGQERIIDSIMSGRDVLCVMPTGAGKSLCYQVPALMLEGITLVISPLISLMKDQVTALVQNGVAAAYMNSSLTPSQYGRVLQNVRNGRYKIIYVAPERLTADGFAGICADVKISLVAIDEAHCISQWGQDFRPSYLKITGFIAGLPRRPVVGAFTATATDKVKADIEDALELSNPFKITTGFDRPNLFYAVLRPESKNSKLTELVGERGDRAGIVYCATRKAVEEVCDLLCGKGFSASRYHAGLSDDERRRNQEDFIYDRVRIMVATNAFGMGIDKSNVSFVIHYNMPKDLESYYQEAGRAGRDGEKADCILLYSPGDVHTNRFLIERSEERNGLPDEERGRLIARDLDRLKQMTYYATTNDCLRAFILRYFGEKASAYCGSCENCLTQFETVNVTVEAQKILSCVIRTGSRFGKRMICDILRGSKSEKLTRLGLDGVTTYGIMADCSVKRLYDIIGFLEEGGYLTVSEGDYPVLLPTDMAAEVLYGGKSLCMKSAKPKPPAAKKRKKPLSQGDADPGLLSELKKLRRALAEIRSVPPYVIFTDATLADMCRRRPTAPDEFLAVSGVGNTKLKLYGEAFMQIIKKLAD